MYKLNIAESLNFFFYWLRKLALLNFVLAFFMSLFRISAWLHFATKGQLDGYFSNLVDALITGSRFDIALLCYVSLIPMLYLFFVTLRKVERPLENFGQLVRPYYLVLFFLMSLFLALDLLSYKFLHAHIGLASLQTLIDEPDIYFSKVLENSQAFLILSVIAATIYLWLILKITKVLLAPFRLKQSFRQNTALNYIPAFAFALILLLLGIWGSFRQEPLQPEEAFFSQNEFVNYLAGNSLFFLAYSYEPPRPEAAAKPSSPSGENIQLNLPFLSAPESEGH